MDVTKGSLAIIGSPVSPAPGGDTDWLGRLESIIKGIKELGDLYIQMKGGATPPAPRTVSEMIAMRNEAEPKRIEERIVTMPESKPSEVKELAEVLLKALTIFEGMGKGEAKIGDAILSLPLTVSQTRGYLEKFIRERYR